MTDTIDIARRVSMTANGDTYEIWLDANRYHYRTDGFAVLMLEGMNHSYPRRVQSAAIKAALKAIVELHGKLEAELQRLELVREQRDNELRANSQLEAELAAMKGDQVPVAEIKFHPSTDKHPCMYWFGKQDRDFPVGTQFFTAPQKPVVLPIDEMSYKDACEFVSINGMRNEDRPTLAMRVWNSCRKAAFEAAGGIVKDGE